MFEANGRTPVIRKSKVPESRNAKVRDTISRREGTTGNNFSCMNVYRTSGEIRTVLVVVETTGASTIP